MGMLDQLHITDIRDKLPRKTWSIGTRPATTSATLHYNGPEVPQYEQSGAGLLARLIADTKWQMRPGGLGATDGGDGIQYIFIVDALGAILQTRDLNAALWHCRNNDGNTHSIPIHFPIGGVQDVSDVQWQSGITLLSALMIDFSFTCDKVKAHLEWSSTTCPGPNLMRRLTAWRAGEPLSVAQHGGVFHIHHGVEVALVRNAPIRKPDNVVLKMYADDTLVLGKVVSGESINGNDRWGWRADGAGFVHSSLYQ